VGTIATRNHLPRQSVSQCRIDGQLQMESRQKNWVCMQNMWLLMLGMLSMQNICTSINEKLALFWWGQICLDWRHQGRQSILAFDTLCQWTTGKEFCIDPYIYRN